MTTRATAPLGAPCWTDLWTSDVESARRFYGELLGWTAEEPNTEFGGYFMFTREGIPVAGAMGARGDETPKDTWTLYLQTDDMDKVLHAAESEGGQVTSGAMTIADIGIQAALVDPTGAALGVWQPGTFQGITVFAEHGAPNWFELLTRDFASAVAFYRDVFHWEIETLSDTDEFRYAVMKDPSGDGELAGIMDASRFLDAGVASHWSTYWHTDELDVTLAAAVDLGGSVLVGAEDTPYGRLAQVADPRGAKFNLRTPPQ